MNFHLDDRFANKNLLSTRGKNILEHFSRTGFFTGLCFQLLKHGLSIKVKALQWYDANHISKSFAGCPFASSRSESGHLPNPHEVKEIADPETTTPNGCTCTSLCGATIDDLFFDDWCYTADECGLHGFIRGWWDYCLYKDSAKPDYTAMTWQEKQDFLWSKVKEDSTFGEYHPEAAFGESLLTTFENEWDVMPNGRVKVSHVEIQGS